MATTIPTKFTGTPTLNADKLAILKDWYKLSLGDMDKATDPDDNSYYTAYADALESVLDVLYDKYPDTVIVGYADQFIKKGLFKNKTAIAVGVVCFVTGAVIVDGRLFRKTKKIFAKKTVWKSEFDEDLAQNYRPNGVL